MPRPSSAPGAFTLTELMTVLCIVAILAIIAIPMHARYADDTKLLEPELTAEAIWPLMVHAWKDGEFDQYVMPNPWYAYGGAPSEVDVGKQAHTWPADSAFAEIGYAPSGASRCLYFGYGRRGGVGLNAVCDVNGDMAQIHFNTAMGDGAMNGEAMSTVYECAPHTNYKDGDPTLDTLGGDPYIDTSSSGWSHEAAYSMGCR